MTATMAAPEHSFGKVKLGMDEEYEGELVGGVPWGQGRAAFADGSAFVGGWRDGAFDGVGRLHTSAPALQKPASRSGGSLYRGEFRRGAEDGLGVLQEQGVTFKGQFKAGLKGGWGLESRMDGRDVYMGQFHGGRRHGLALMRRGRGVLLVERWEHGAKVKEGAEVASEFVGGMAEAAAAVAEAAFVALASLADRKAAEAPEVLPAFFSRKKSLPRPTVAQVAGEAAGRRLSRAEAEVQALRKKLGKALDEMEELAGAARKAEKACESRGREIEELKQRHEKCKGDLASCKVQLRDADFKVEAIMESQQELVTELLHKQTSLHQQRLDVTLAQHRHLVLSLQMQLDQAKTALEAHESGSHAPARSGAGAGADGGGSKKKILMEPLVAEGMSREAARLALSEDALTLSGPRGYAAVGKPIATSKVAYSFRVERLEKEVEGYVGVICEASPSLSSCFALLYDDGTLGSGRLRACDEMEGSRRVENGAVVVLQVLAHLQSSLAATFLNFFVCWRCVFYKCRKVANFALSIVLRLTRDPVSHDVLLTEAIPP